MTRKTFEKLAICILIFGLQVAAGLWLHRLEHSNSAGGRTFHIGDRDAPAALRNCKPGDIGYDCVWSMQHRSTGGGGTFTTAAAPEFPHYPMERPMADCEGHLWLNVARTGPAVWARAVPGGVEVYTLPDPPECGPQQERQ